MTRTEMERVRPMVVGYGPVNLRHVARKVWGDTSPRTIKKAWKAVEQARNELAALDFVRWLVHGIVTVEK